MPNYKQRLQALLYELFQFDSADLDFGFYAVMNQKREQIGQFIQHELLDAVTEGLQHVAAQSQVEAQAAFDQARQNLINALGQVAFQDDDLNPQFAQTPLGQTYQATRDALDAAIIAEDMEAQIYNDLYAFFSRYYQDGDFISQRRYGRSDRYAIPYNGQEVHLHWANFDQYYVKTGVHFNNYSFTVPVSGAGSQASVVVRLTKVDIPRDNLKGEKRFFVHATDQTITWDEDAQTLVIPMEYRPLTAGEISRVGTRNQQDKLLQEAHDAIIQAVPDTFLRARLLEPDPQKHTAQGRLAYHLNRYAAENTRDFFVHKSLGRFLRREFDCYLKAEILRLEDINFDDLVHARRAAARLKTTRAIGEKIITFLDQLESFQRRLFLKRKFVLQSDYCLTLDKVPVTHRAELYPDILGNEHQLAEWQTLYGVTVTSATDLDTYPHLMLDTAFFASAFKARLLACFDNLDDATDGLFVHGENFQALSLLMPKYREQVQCIHIDPPYNTQTSGFLYKNNYQHSSWLAMMEDRIRVSVDMLAPKGSYLCHIDENEYEHLYLLFEHFPVPNAGTVVWDKRNPMNAGRGIATQHEYVIWRSKLETPLYLRPKSILSMLKAAAEIIKKHKGVSEEAQKEYAAWLSGNSELSGGEKAYRYLDEQGRIYQSVSLRAPEPRTDPKFYEPLVHPKTGKPCAVPPNGFSRTPETLQAMVDRGDIIFGKDESTQPRQKMLLTTDSRRQMSSVIQDAHKGKADVSPLGVEFPYCHPVSLYTDLIGTVLDSSDGIVLDFFAGSGTTAHAVMNLNQEDGNAYKYILVEMGEYFDAVLRPRIQKVVFADEWKGGRPVLPDNGQANFATTGQSHMFHYIRLESYDDTFHNIRFRNGTASHETASDVQAGDQNQVYQPQLGDLLDAVDQWPDYLLSYMLDHETKGSPTLLDIQQFERPFDYRLRVTNDDGILAPHPVDLAATFNFLIGLTVRTIRHYEHQGQPYLRVTGISPDGQHVCVLWRNVQPLDDLDAERDWVLANVLNDTSCDRLYVNGENAIPGALLIETEFKRRMFEDVR